MDAISIVAKYLQKQANENQHFKKQLEEAAAEIKKIEELQETLQVYNDELFALKAFQQRCTQQRQQQVEAEAEAAALIAYEELTQLNEQHACIEQKRLASEKLYLKLQEDLKTVQQIIELKRQLHEGKEQLKILQQELKALKMHSAAENQESMRELCVAKEQRNQLANILEEIYNLNELKDDSQTLQSLDQKKHELLQKPQQLQQNEQQNLAVIMQPASTAAPSADVFDPINFLQPLQSQEQNTPSLQNILDNLFGVSQRENEQEEIEQPTTSLRSILRTPPGRVSGTISTANDRNCNQ